MTIKEMQKCYKKVNKMVNEYEFAKTNARNIDCYTFTYSGETVSDIMETARRLEVACKRIIKMATVTLNLSDLFNDPVKAMCNNAMNEETFVRWCITAGVEYKQEETEESAEG